MPSVQGSQCLVQTAIIPLDVLCYVCYSIGTVETRTRRIKQRLERDGWYQPRQGKKHDIYWHLTIEAVIQVPRHRTLKPGLARAIAKIAGWED